MYRWSSNTSWLISFGKLWIFCDSQIRGMEKIIHSLKDWCLTSQHLSNSASVPLKCSFLFPDVTLLIQHLQCICTVRLVKMGALQRIRWMRVLFGFISSPDGDCTKRTSFLVLPLNSYLDTYMFVSASSLYRLFPRRTVKSVCCWCLCPCLNTTSASSQLQVVILLHEECELVRPSVSVACSLLSVSCVLTFLGSCHVSSSIWLCKPS